MTQQAASVMTQASSVQQDMPDLDQDGILAELMALDEGNAEEEGATLDGDTDQDGEDADDQDDADGDDEDSEDGDNEEDDDTDDEDGDEGDDEEDEDADEDAGPELTDDTSLNVTIGDEEVEVTLGELKDLVTRVDAIEERASEVETQRVAAEEVRLRSETAYQTLLDHYRGRLEQYQGIDFLAASERGVPADKIKAAQTEMQSLQQYVGFLESGLDGALKSRGDSEAKDIESRIDAAEKALEDPASPTYVKGFRDDYPKLVEFIEDKGVDVEKVTKALDPALWKLLHNAFRFENAKASTDKLRKPKSKTKTTGTKNKTTRGGETASGSKGSKTKAARALQNLESNPGSQQAALEAFAALG